MLATQGVCVLVESALRLEPPRLVATGPVRCVLSAGEEGDGAAGGAGGGGEGGAFVYDLHPRGPLAGDLGAARAAGDPDRQTSGGILHPFRAVGAVLGLSTGVAGLIVTLG